MQWSRDSFSPGGENGMFYLNLFGLEKSISTESFGIIICSEDGYPGLFRKLKREGAGSTVGENHKLLYHALLLAREGNKG